MPQKIKSKSSGELSKHSCVNVITVLCGPAQVTHSDSWLPDSFSFWTKKMGPFSIRKHRARSLKLWNNLALCSQQWMKMQTLHKYCSNKKQHKKIQRGAGKMASQETRGGGGTQGPFRKDSDDLLWNSMAHDQNRSGANEMRKEHVHCCSPAIFCFVFSFPLTWLWGSPLGSPSSDPPAPAAPSILVQACRQRWSACSAAGSKNRTKKKTNKLLLDVNNSRQKWTNTNEDPSESERKDTDHKKLWRKLHSHTCTKCTRAHSL